MIRVEDLHKSFGEVKAVRGVSFEAEDGRITGLLGPNGAGKSTTLRVLYTVLKPDEAAQASTADVVRDALGARRRIGTLPHGSGLYPHLTARENIRYYAKLYACRTTLIERTCAKVIDDLDIGEFRRPTHQGVFAGATHQGCAGRALVHRAARTSSWTSRRTAST